MHINESMHVSSKKYILFYIYISLFYAIHKKYQRVFDVDFSRSRFMLLRAKIGKMQRGNPMKPLSVKKSKCK